MTTPASTEALAVRLEESAKDFERPPSVQSQENIRAINAMNEAAAALRALLAEREAMRGALRQAQSALAMMIEPSVIGATTVLHAYAIAIAAEAKVRQTLSALTPPAPTPTKAEL